MVFVSRKSEHGLFWKYNIISRWGIKIGELANQLATQTQYNKDLTTK